MVKIFGVKNNNYRIETKQNEDMDLLRTLDAIFLKKRGYIVKLPPFGSSVATCMSGGGDSVANIFILLNGFHYQVYPFFINRGQSAYKWEKRAVEYYDKVFLKKFPNLYHKTLEIKINTPAREYKDDLREVKKSFRAIDPSSGQYLRHVDSDMRVNYYFQVSIILETLKGGMI